MNSIRPGRARAVGVLVGLAALVGLWIAGSRPMRSGVQDLLPTGARDATGSTAEHHAEGVDESPATELRLGPGGPSEAGRTAGDSSVRRSATRHRVLDARGAPIAGAVLSWAAITDEPRPQGGAVDWAELALRTRFTVSKEDGGFEPHLLLTEADVASGGVLWITSPGHAAKAISASSSRDEIRIPTEIRLDDAPPARALVLHRGGSTTAGTRVLQRLSARELDAGDGSDRAWWEKRLLYRSWTLEAEESIAMPALGGEMVVHAELGAERSALWTGREPETCELVLGPSFTAFGTIRATTGEVVGAGSVQVASISGLTRTMVERVLVRHDGRWGPVPLPVVPGCDYRFVHVSADWAPAEALLPAPAEGSHVEVPIVVVPGLELEVDVLGRGEPLAGALVSAHWLHESRWMDTEGRTSSSGRAALGRIPIGAVWLRANAEGFSERLLGPLEFQTDPGAPFPLELEPAGSLRLRCTQAGGPVRDYDVLFWSTDPNSHDLEVVRDSEDGTCRIGRAPLGGLTLIVSAMDGTQSSPRELRVVDGVESEVEIELPAPLSGRGRVVDASTMDPIQGARVQATTSFRGLRIAPRGRPIEVDPSGSFELANLQAGENIVYVTAAGYEPVTHAVFGTEGGELELGVLPLRALGGLTLELAGGAELDPASYRVSLHGTEYSGEVPFDRDGRAHFARAERTLNSVVLRAEDGSQTSFFLEGRSMPEGPLQLEATTRPAFAVRLAISSPALARDDLVVGVLYRRTDGILVGHYQAAAAPGVVELRCSPTEHMTLVASSGSEYLARRAVRLSAVAGTRVDLELSEASVLVRVVDERADPIAGASVWFASPGDPTGWIVRSITDAAGEGRARGIGSGLRTVTVFHPEKGTQAGIRVTLEGHPEERVELELSCQAVLAVRLMDGAHPVQGATVRITDPVDPVMDLAQLFSDAAGEARKAALAAGTYRVSISAPGHWPATAELRAQEIEHHYTIQVRRLGSVEIEVLRSGLVLAGARIEIQSEELGDSVAEWVARGEAGASSSELRTDAKGRLRVDGIPHGRYRWSVDLAADGTREGSLVVPPAAVGAARIELL